MQRAIRYIFGFILAISASFAMSAEPIAMVTDVSGGATADGKAIPLLAELPEGSVLELSSDSLLTIVYFSSGEEFSLKGSIKALLKKDAVYVSGKRLPGESVLAATESANLSPTGLSQAAIVMRAPAAPENPLKQRYPFGSKILEAKPKLKWEMPENGYHYRVEILADDGGSLYMAETGETALSLPNDLQLPRNEMLTWEIEARRGIQTLYAFTDFMVVTEELAASIERRRATIGSSFSRQLIFAKYLDELGLHHEASHYWDKLSKMRPNDPVLKSKTKQ